MTFIRNTSFAQNSIIAKKLATNPFVRQQLSNPETRKELRERALAQKTGAIASNNKANFDLYSGIYELTNMFEASPDEDTFVYSSKGKQNKELSADVFNLKDDVFKLRDDSLFA